jgi:protein-disulfide isomerase
MPLMKLRPLAISAVALLALAACSKKDQTSSVTTEHMQVAAVPAPAGKSWTDVVSITPEGGVRMGNPDAAVKIVEYASFTCPHCKKFEDEGGEELPKKYVSTGKVSYEFRSFLIHGPEAPITALMLCRGAEPFFALKHQLYAAQDTFMAPLIAMTPAENQAMSALPPAQQFQQLLEKMNLFPFFVARGLPRAQAEKCLTDQKALDEMAKHQDHAQTADAVNQTPTFFINGQMQSDVDTWEKLDAKLTQMIG